MHALEIMRNFRKLVMHRSTSCQNDSLIIEMGNLEEENWKGKISRSKSIPSTIENLYDEESFSGEIGESYPIRYRTRPIDTRWTSRTSLFSRMTGLSILSLTDQYRSSRTAFLIISLSFSLAVVVITLVIIFL